MSHALLRSTSTLLLTLVIQGCSDYGVKWGENNAVYTPVYSDNRQYYLEPPSGAGTTQKLLPLTSGNVLESEEIPRNSPLSIIVRSVEIPSTDPLVINDRTYKSPVSKTADYAVVLDVGVSEQGDVDSIVVWY